ncbi:hypothetical protein [Paenibacillus sacheonensis]|uniref:Uncharacterized protein n=1 Tax=Paenibacillus sacheonensis TaxID=742054 RepID=A0A7X4YUD9_9BACL|nr:hypothetical protein [Paenibacillus sacheonensis]MBM7566787.1 uncharacterized Zn finger protein (UPF0148 family) [Paenibacillus sacheonensis]NBC71639.1 hypothetical protein [Paenibacillus sacheonensis]
MNEQHQHEQQDGPVICPWCQSEIVWDEEIGPERECPHCENELSGYRTLQFDMDGSEEDEPEEDEAATDAWEADGSPDLTDFVEYGSERLAMTGAVERLLEDQLEAPECPSCRELMLEAGTHVVKGDQFQPRIPAALGLPILEKPFSLVLYVCPSCFHTENRLSVKDQEHLVSRLALAGDEL